MITSVVRQALRIRGEEPAVLCHTGDPTTTRRELAGFRLRPGDRLIDLDAHRMGDLVSVADVENESGGPEEGTGTAGLVVVLAASLTDLRRVLTTATALPRTVHLVVAVVDTPGHQGPLLPSPPGIDEWNDLLEARVRRTGKRGWVCELFFPNSVETALAMDCVLHGVRGGRRSRRPVPLVGLHGNEGALWRPGDIATTGVSATGPVPLRRVSPKSDLVLRTDEVGLPVWEDPAVPHLDTSATTGRTWSSLTRTVPPRAGEVDPHRVPPVDEYLVNPIGFTKKTGGPMGDLTAHGDRAVVMEGKRVLCVLPEDGTVTDLDIGRLRYLRGVRIDWTGHSGPLAAVRAVASLAAGGVPLIGRPVPPWAADLGDPLVELLASVEEWELADPLTREEHSVRLRRAALGTHSQSVRWRALATRAGVPLPSEPLVTVMLCTRRPELVGFALAQIARQRGARFELVLAMHGFTADLPQVRSALREFAATGIPLTVHEAPSDQVFGAVLNDAADRASGTVIAKWDDDDWYGPDHLADMLMARHYSSADLVGVTQDLVYLQELDVTVWRSYQTEKPSPDVVGSTIVIDRSVLDAVGGFRPLPRAIDSQLLLAVRRNGGRIFRTHGLGYLLRRAGEGHTWGADMGYFLRRNSKQWSGWRPSALLEGAPEPMGGGHDPLLATPTPVRTRIEGSVRPGVPGTPGTTTSPTTMGGHR
ncbi:glycosyltransferase family 2 protein [Nocardiopsis sp. JB363]|uniref:glycosyltransferase n=1 Tax=Nocardiopsis sp. JB363 TaxID=1434837 RepID=UPI000979FCDD|nr:glycosyltransferase family A protein [Nocardiopsis sp. JB363]SIO91223.1 glycosyl transferase, family 2 [Nocardiopsis sp. JB363]